MKINSINTINYNSKNISFKHTAVPYPEYESAYSYRPSPIETRVNSLMNRISDLFSTKVTNEANEIKKNIDNIYSRENSREAKSNSKKQLLSILA